MLNRRNGSLRSLNHEELPCPADRMAETQAVNFPARDGLKVHGLLTIPKGDGRTSHLLILCPAKQPFTDRFYGGYDAEAQFYASRGYAVLRLNYRGSPGYGYNYLQAGRGEIAGRIVDDIHDAAKWAVAQKICRPGDICLYGEGLAGGLVLVAAAEDPELYGAAINQNGVTAWRRFSELWSNSPYASWFEINTHAVFNRSPLSLAPKLRVPVLIVHDYENSSEDELLGTLKSKKINYSIADYYNGVDKPFAIALVRARSIEAFLAKSLPPSRSAEKTATGN